MWHESRRPWPRIAYGRINHDVPYCCSSTAQLFPVTPFGLQRSYPQGHYIIFLKKNKNAECGKEEAWINAIRLLFNCNWIQKDALQVAFWESSTNEKTEMQEAINIPLWIKRVRLETLISERPKQINTWDAHKATDVSMRPLQCHTHNNKSMRGPWFPISKECVSHFTALDPLTGHLHLWTILPEGLSFHQKEFQGARPRNNYRFHRRRRRRTMDPSKKVVPPVRNVSGRATTNNNKVVPCIREIMAPLLSAAGIRYFGLGTFLQTMFYWDASGHWITVKMQRNFQLKDNVAAANAYFQGFLVKRHASREFWLVKHFKKKLLQALETLQIFIATRR